MLTTKAKITQKIILIVQAMLVCLLFALPLKAQPPVAPPMWGIAKMTFRVSSEALTQRYYGQFLGFDKAFSYSSPLGKVDSYKVNDRQFLEFITDSITNPGTRLVSLSLETDDAEQMRLFLASKGVTVPAATTIDGAGNTVFTVHDDEGNPIEFLQWGVKSLHRASQGKYLSSRRISQRIHHAGLYTSKLIDNPRFYTDILGFKTILRVPDDKLAEPQILYFQIPGTAEFIEHYPTNTRSFSHPCFVATDMQEVVYTLKERKTDEKLANPTIGKGRRWLLNLYNADGIRTEFTEIFVARY